MRYDVIAGVVLAAILVPQGMAYAELAGLPPVNGLYTTIAVLVGYALLGPSRILVLGPDASVAPMIAVAITPLLVTDDPSEAIALAAMLALMVGAIQVGLGLGKRGFVADLLSKEVQVGYMNGLAITIIVGQLPKLGFSTDADGFFEEVTAFLDGLDQTNTTALAIGLATLALLLLLPRVTKKIPAVLVGVLGATLVTGVLNLAEKGVDVVGPLPQGLPSLTFPSVPIETLGPLLAASFGIVLVSLTDQIATSASFAARRGETVDANQEMVGMGGANMVAGMFQGFAVSASGSRTAVAEQSGAKSQATGLVGAVVVALMLLLFPALLANLPQPALAAVVIVAAISLFDGPILRTYYRMRKSAFVIAMITSLGVILFGVLEGILIAVVLSILLFFKRNWWPEGEVLGQVQDLDGWHSTARYPEAEEIDGIVVYRWDAPLFFANAGIFRQEILALVEQPGTPMGHPRLRGHHRHRRDRRRHAGATRPAAELARHQHRVRRDARQRRGHPRAVRPVRHTHPGARVSVDGPGTERHRAGGQDQRERSGRPRPVLSSCLSEVDDHLVDLARPAQVCGAGLTIARMAGVPTLPSPTMCAREPPERGDPRGIQYARWWGRGREDASWTVRRRRVSDDRHDFAAPLVEAKLAPPSVRRDVVDRRRLTQLLNDSGEGPRLHRVRGAGRVRQVDRDPFLVRHPGCRAHVGEHDSGGLPDAAVDLYRFFGRAHPARIGTPRAATPRGRRWPRSTTLWMSS